MLISRETPKKATATGVKKGNISILPQKLHQLASQPK
jgi:hypothetical protein